MRAAYIAGIRDFGESRLQEALPKQEQLQDLPDITWHFIGHLQSNKIQKAIPSFDWIHSVDSLKLAQKLDHLAANRPHKPRICLQVKILSDPNKYGWIIPDLLAALPHLNACSNLDIVGLMTIPPLGLSPEETQSVFQRTWELAQSIREKDYPNLTLRHLSMGMSADYPLAIAAGATLVRLGRVIFGDRPN